MPKYLIQNPKALHQLKNKQTQKSVYESKLNAIILRTVQPTDNRFVESVKKLYPLEGPQILNTNIAMEYFKSEHILSCVLCNDFIYEDDNTFEDTPIIMYHDDDDKCEMQRNAHKSWLLNNLEDYSNSSNPLEPHILSCHCGKFIDLLYQFTSDSEEKNGAFELNAKNLSCPFCLKKKISLIHFNK